MIYLAITGLSLASEKSDRQSLLKIKSLYFHADVHLFLILFQSKYFFFYFLIKKSTNTCFFRPLRWHAHQIPCLCYCHCSVSPKKSLKKVWTKETLNFFIVSWFDNFLLNM